MKDDYNILNYIENNLILHYYKNVNIDFLNNSYYDDGPYIQILSLYKNEILQTNDQLYLFVPFNENTDHTVLEYLLDMYVYSLYKIKIIEKELIQVLNPKIKKLFEIVIYAFDSNEPTFKSAGFLKDKNEFIQLLTLISKTKLIDKKFIPEIYCLIEKIILNNTTVKIVYEKNPTDFIIDLYSYIDYRTKFNNELKDAKIRKTVDNFDFVNENYIEIPPISKTFKFNNLLLYQDMLVKDYIITYTLIQIDIINLFELKQKVKRNKKHKYFNHLMTSLKENDYSLTTIDPFINKYRNCFIDFMDYINLFHKDDETIKRPKTFFFIPYCIIHIVKRYEINKFIKTKNPLIKLKKDIILTDDNVIINLFKDEPKKIAKKPKKPKKRNIDISNLSNNSIIEIIEPIEPIEDQQLEETNNEDSKSETTTETTETEDNETDDEEGFQLVTYKTNNNYFDYYDIVFNNIIFNNRNIIEILIYNLYESNINFVNLMKQYNIIRIIKDIHNDKFFLNETLHFNSILINTKTGSSTTPLHFYIEHNKIVNITQVINLI